MNIRDELLLRRAEAVMAETSRLRRVHEEIRENTRRQVEEMARIEAELDPMLPHPPEEARAVRELLAEDTPS